VALSTNRYSVEELLERTADALKWYAEEDSLAVRRFVEDALAYTTNRDPYHTDYDSGAAYATLTWARFWLAQHEAKDA
jgi:hypothetical protein